MTQETTAETDVAQTVTTLAALAGLTPSPEEMAAFVRSYPTTRASLDALYAVPGVRYEEPCVVFSAIPQV
jgi:hypothetical protein